jgi:hypothetical protein
VTLAEVRLICVTVRCPALFITVIKTSLSFAALLLYIPPEKESFVTGKLAPDLRKYRDIAQFESRGGDFVLIVRARSEDQSLAYVFFLKPKTPKARTRFNGEDAPFLTAEGSIPVGRVLSGDSLKKDLSDRLDDVFGVYDARFPKNQVLECIRRYAAATAATKRGY